MPFYGVTVKWTPGKFLSKTIVNVSNGFSLKGPAWDHKGNILVLSNSKADWMNVSHCQGIIVQGKSRY